MQYRYQNFLMVPFINFETLPLNVAVIKKNLTYKKKSYLQNN